MCIPGKAAVVILPICLIGATPADAEACLRGALVGGVAGHYAIITPLPGQWPAV
jgi:hypothetical protein